MYNQMVCNIFKHFRCGCMSTWSKLCWKWCLFRRFPVSIIEKNIAMPAISFNSFATRIFLIIVRLSWIQRIHVPAHQAKFLKKSNPKENRWKDENPCPNHLLCLSIRILPRYCSKTFETVRHGNGRFVWVSVIHISYRFVCNWLYKQITYDTFLSIRRNVHRFWEWMWQWQRLICSFSTVSNTLTDPCTRNWMAKK